MGKFHIRLTFAHSNGCITCHTGYFSAETEQQAIDRAKDYMYRNILRGYPDGRLLIDWCIDIKEV